MSCLCLDLGLCRLFFPIFEATLGKHDHHVFDLIETPLTIIVFVNRSEDFVDQVPDLAVTCALNKSFEVCWIKVIKIVIRLSVPYAVVNEFLLIDSAVAVQIHF
jgi:hypothetical protein